MIPSKDDITGILLSGGKSSRMGREKGNIRVGDRFLYKYPLRVLEDVCGEILISNCEKDIFEEDHEQVCDEIPDIGPISGIYSALKASSNEINIILSYDLPLMNEALLLELVKYSGEADVVLPALSVDKPEPLCGVYHKRTVPKIKEHIDQGNYAVHKLIPELSSKILVIDNSMPFYHHDLFMNINSLTDIDRLHGML